MAKARKPLTLLLSAINNMCIACLKSTVVQLTSNFHLKAKSMLCSTYSIQMWLLHLLSLLRLAPCPEASIVEEILAKNSAVDDPVQ